MPVDLERGGLKVRGAPLWLDARRKTPLCVVSHAHSDHLARHDTVIATKETLALMTHRLGAPPAAVPLRFGEAHHAHGHALELLPAGHVLGAAQVRLTRPDGRRIAYSGDLCVEPSRTATPAQTAHCDVLVLESTFGHPRFRFPRREAAFDEVAQWARTQLEQGRRPVLSAYTLGKSQEAIRQLTERGLAVCAHERIAAVSAVYASLGVPQAVRTFDGAFRDGEVGIFPPFGTRQLLAGVERVTTAVLTGWALEPWAARRYRADVAFPVSDHADFESLVAYAQATGAREVLTLHGFADELAKGLKQRGVFARPVAKATQLELAL